MAFLNIINQVKENTSKIISEKGYDNVDFVVEYSRSGFGDITCNVAFLLAKNLKKNPQEVAQEFAGEYNLGNDLEKVEAHKSGYLNFFYQQQFIQQYSFASITKGELWQC